MPRPSDRTLATGAVFVVAGAAYLATTNRVVGFIDRGELSAVACTLGIAHPTGYPLLALLGRLASLLYPAHPIVALGGFAALLTAAGAAAVAWLADALLAAHGPALTPRPRAAVAAGAALLLATAPPWWQQANGWEAYPLHALLLPLVLLAWHAWTVRAERADRGAARHAALFGFVWGLAFANHMTSVLLAPALLVDFLWRRQPGAARLRQAGVALAGFVLGLTPYLVLVVRAHLEPRFAWSDPRRWRTLVDHVTAREFQGWMFESAETASRQAAYLVHVLPRGFAWLGLLAALGGLAWLLDRRLRHGVFLLLLFAAGAVYACGYGIRDIDAYFLTALAATALLAAHGLAWAVARFRPGPVLAALAALVLVNGATHWRECDESRMTLADDLVTRQLGELPPRAVLLTTQWDFALSASYYRQVVERFRPDVTVIDTHLMENAWYVRELARRDPGLVAPVHDEMARFLEAVVPFVEHRPYDAARIMAAYAPFAENLVHRALEAGRPVHVTAEVGAPFVMGLARVPVALSYRLVRDSTYLACELPSWPPPQWRGRMDAPVAGLHGLYAGAYGTRARYEALQGHPERAAAWLDAALACDPGIDPQRIPPQPLDGREILTGVARTFESLRETRAQLGR